MSKNILIISDRFANGGLETHILSYANKLKQEKFHLFLLSDCEYEHNLDLFDQTYPISFNVNDTVQHLFQHINIIKNIIEKEHIDTIHVHPFLGIIPSFFAAQECKTPLFLTLHGPISIENDYGPLYDIFLKVLLFNNTKVFLISQELNTLSLGYGREENLIYLPNPIDTNLFQASLSSKNIFEKWAIVSRLDEEKIDGIKKCIEIALQCNVKRIEIFGDGNAKNSLSQYTQFSNTQTDIVFNGFSTSLEKDLDNNFSLVAGMGRVALEAASMNLPVLLVGYDGIKGMLDENLLFQSSWYNFSGRGIQNISHDNLIKQFHNVQNKQEKYQLRNLIQKKFSVDILSIPYIQYIKTEKHNSFPYFLKLQNIFKLSLDKPIPYLENKTLLKHILILMENLLDTSNPLKEEIHILQKEWSLNQNQKLYEENLEMKHKINIKKRELETTKQELQTTKQELYTIKQSKIWKLANKYYIIRDTTPIIKHIFKITKSLKNKGFIETAKIINNKISNKLIKIKPVKNIIESNYNVSKVIENKNAKKVSVILPVYNQADMIDESIESILSQTYQNFELIIVNDGSTDGVENVLKKYNDDTRIIILNQENQKLPTALNNGFHFATGGYYTWTSADNIMLPRQLEVLVQYLEENPTKGMVFSNYMVIDDEGNPLNDPSFRPQNQDKNNINIMKLPNNVTFENLHDSGDNYIGASFMYRKSVAMSIGKYTNDTFGGEDYDYWLRIHNLYPIGFVEDVLYKYRVHNNTLNSKAKELNLYENIQRLLKRDKQRRIFLKETLEYVQINSDFKLPNQKSKNKILLFNKIKNIDELSNINLENKNYLMVLLVDNNIENIDFNILEKFDMLVCSDDFIYSYLDVKDNFKYKLLYLDLNNENDKNFFIKVTTNRLFDKLNIIEKPEILPQYTLNKKIKIAFILESFDKGGLEKVVYNLVTKLNSDKFEFTVLIVGKELGFFGKKLQVSGYNVKILNYNLKLFQEILKVKSFDLINYHYTLFGIDICNQFNIPSIYTVHNTYVWLNNYECAKKTHEYEKIDRFICVSDNVMKYFVNKFQIKNPYLDVIPNGFNLSDFHNNENVTREELNLSKDDFIFINLASINGSKMQMLMVNAMKELKIKYKNFKILFVGNILDEKYYSEILNKIKLFDLEDNIIFLDYVPTQKVGSLLTLSDCFLLPSLYEGWSNAIMEAMYCELPLIVTNVGSSNNLITNEDIGIVINNAVSNLIELDSQEILKIVYSDTFINKDALKSAMINIYEEHETWKKKAKLGKDKILNFYTLDIMAKKYENLFINSYFHLKK